MTEHRAGSVDLSAIQQEYRDRGLSPGTVSKYGPLKLLYGDRKGRFWQSTCQGFGVYEDGTMFFLGTEVDQAALDCLDIIRRHLAPAGGVEPGGDA